MKKVYIIHPFQGKEENLEKIGQICRAIANMGFLPVSPVHVFSFLDDSIPEERKQALKLCQELVKVCDQAWLFGDWEKSEGCKIEIQAAEETGVPVVDMELLLIKLEEFKNQRRERDDI